MQNSRQGSILTKPSLLEDKRYGLQKQCRDGKNEDP